MYLYSGSAKFHTNVIVQRWLIRLINLCFIQSLKLEGLRVLIWTKVGEFFFSLSYHANSHDLII